MGKKFSETVIPDFVDKIEKIPIRTANQRMRVVKELKEGKEEEIPIKKYGDFWYSDLPDKFGERKWHIDHRKFIEHLRHSGFHRYDINDDYIFIYIKHRVIEEIPITRFKDEVIHYINNLNEKKLGGITREQLLSMFYTSPDTYFNSSKLSMLGLEKNLVLNADTKDSGFIYYSNGFVRCSADGYQLYPYDKLDGYVFRKQVKDRKFIKGPSDGMFKKFASNITGGNEQRLKSLQTLIGYLLHSFFEAEIKAVSLTDSSISENAEGRTGKTLIGYAISHIKNVCEISGKSFKADNKHRYESAKIDTQIVFLNDLLQEFDFECLFNDISDRITVDRKSMHPFTIRAKMLIAANDTFRIEGESAKARIFEFELANYYNKDFTPKIDLGAWFFGNEWAENDWLSFDNFMIECLSLYLKHGVIEAEPINLEKRHQLGVIKNRDVIEFFDKKIEEKELIRNVEYDKRELHEEFLEQYPEYREDRLYKKGSNFTKHLKIYASYSPELKGVISERRTNGRYLIRFEKKEANQQKLQL